MEQKIAKQKATKKTKGKVERKTRSDKKHDVQPTVSVELYDLAARISYITNTPIKDVGEQLCIRAWMSMDFMESIKWRFRRELWWDNRIMFMGQAERASYTCKDGNPNKRRLTMRFTGPMHECLKNLAFALDCSVAAAAGLLLKEAIYDPDILHPFIASRIHRQLDRERSKALDEILRYLNRNLPEDRRITLAMLIGQLLGHAIERGQNFKASLNDWIDERFSK